MEKSYGSGYNWVVTDNGKVARFAVGDHYAGGLWDLQKEGTQDSLENKSTRAYLFEAIYSISPREYFELKEDVGKDFIELLEKQISNDLKNEK